MNLIEQHFTQLIVPIERKLICLKCPYDIWNFLDFFVRHFKHSKISTVQDCWDAEILTSYGWVECVGNADRACYDLRQHYKATGVKVSFLCIYFLCCCFFSFSSNFCGFFQLTAEKPLPAPKSVEMIEAKPNMAIIGTKFKEHAKKVFFNDYISLK